MRLPSLSLPALPRPLTLPPVGWALAGLLAFYLFAGLFGHDPWASEDVVHLAVARDFFDPGHGIGLSLAGRLFFAPPLYYWSAAVSGNIFGWLLPMHDALRLASGFWSALVLMTLYYAGREMYGQQAAAAVPILMTGSFGLIAHTHEAQPMLVLLAALGFCLLALTLLPRKPRAAAALSCFSLVLAALGGGLGGWILITLIFLSAFAFLRAARQQAGKLFFAFSSALILLAAMAWLLYLAAPVWFSGWAAQEWHSLSGNWRYSRDAQFILNLFPVFSWPLWPLAGWSLWRSRQNLCQPVVLLPLAIFVVLLVSLPALFPVQRSTAILLLPPLAILATPGVLTLRRGAANAFDWFSGVAFSVFAILLWAGWIAMVFGYPARLAERAVILKPGFSGHFDLWFFVLAVVVTLWWLWLALAMPRSPYRCLVRWSTGFAIGWLLVTSLWLPWIDYGKSYRSVAANLAAHMPKHRACVASWQVGQAQIASFAYFEHLRFLPLHGEGRRCQWLLVEGYTRKEIPPPGEGWQRVWEGSRPGDRKERFWLYRRAQTS